MEIGDATRGDWRPKPGIVCGQAGVCVGWDIRICVVANKTLTDRLTGLTVQSQVL